MRTKTTSRQIEVFYAGLWISVGMEQLEPGDVFRLVEVGSKGYVPGFWRVTEMPSIPCVETGIP